MKYRKLRITWSVAWGTLAVTLIGLWVLSYARWDAICQDRWPTFVAVSSYRGYVELIVADNTLMSRGTGWTMTRRPILLQLPRFRNATEFAWSTTPTGTNVAVPYWPLVLSCLALAIVPWLRVRRFSLRTLLIVATVVSVALGLIVWAAS